MFDYDFIKFKRRSWGMRTPSDDRSDFPFRGLSPAGTAPQVYVGTANTKHVALTDIVNPEVLYANVYTYPGGSAPYDIPGTTAVTTAASIEYSGNIYPAQFSGQPNVAIQPGQFIKTDPIGLYIPQGDTFRVRTFFNVGSPNTYPVNLILNNWDEYFDPADLTRGGNMTTKSGAAVFGPVAVLTAGNKNAVYLVGDSIIRGIQDSSVGFGIRACKAANIPYINVARSGEKVSDWVNGINKQYRLKLAQYCSVALFEYGINDCADASQTTDQIKANILKSRNELMANGLKVIHTTITPKSLTADGLTLDPASNPKRIAINNWIRQNFDYIEIADAAEQGRDSGVWKPGYTTDGVHPGSTGANALTQAVNVSLIKSEFI